MRTPAAGKKRRLHVRRIIGVTLILFALLLWNVPGRAQAAGAATLSSGPVVNVALKTLLPQHSINVTNDTEDTQIKNIAWDKDYAMYEGYVDIASSDSDYPIYANYSGQTIYLYTEGDGIALGSSAGQIFQNFKALEDASGFLEHVTDTSDATNMYGMFDNCVSLREADLSTFNDTSGVTGFVRMFQGCESLEKIDFGDGFSTAGAQYMTSMFSGLKSLLELDVSSFDTSNVTGADSMFSGTNPWIHRLDLSGFDLRKVEDHSWFDLTGFKGLEEVVTPKNSFRNHAMKLPYDDFRVVLQDGSLGDEAYSEIPAGNVLQSVTLRRSPEEPTPTVTPSATPEVTASPTAEPTAVPTIRPTTAPTAVPTMTPTAVSTSTPSAVPSATPTRTPTASARTSASPTPPVVTPVRSGTPRPTATSTVSATPAPTSNPSSTATPNGGSGNNNGGSATNSGNYSYYNPYAVVNNGRKGNAYDMPKTGDGDAFRLIAVAALFVTGCIVLISSVPSKKRN